MVSLTTESFRPYNILKLHYQSRRIYSRSFCSSECEKLPKTVINPYKPEQQEDVETGQLCTARRINLSYHRVIPSSSLQNPLGWDAIWICDEFPTFDVPLK